MTDGILGFVIQNISGSDFLLGLATGWFGHMAFRRMIYRKLRKII